MTGPDWLFLPAVELADRVRSGRISSVALTEAYLERIESLNPRFNAIVSTNDRALDQARRADHDASRGYFQGPWHGIPMTIKDSIDTAGVRTTWGTEAFADRIPDRDATAAARLLDAGAVLLGKTNTPEFTLSFETDNLLFGPTRNPHDPSRTAGGSSGGSAASVALGLSAFDIGSDTGGSIRVPSHYCGVAGLKPTSGRVSRHGNALSFDSHNESLTQPGPLARSVRDLLPLLNTIAGPDGLDPRIPPCGPVPEALPATRGLRIAWHGDNGLYRPEPDILLTLHKAVDVLQQSGSRLTETIPQALDPKRYDFGDLLLWMTDGGAWIERELAQAGTQNLSPRTQAQINPARAASSKEFSDLVSNRAHFQAEMLAFMQNFDALLTPVCGFTAPPLGEAETPVRQAGYASSWLHNITGWPAVTVRCGTDSKGLPIGLQVAAAPWCEHLALSVAHELENALGGWRAIEPAE